MKVLRLPVVAMMVAMGVAAQSDPFASLRFLEGKWTGPADGEPGKGVSTLEYRFELSGRFLI